MKLYKCNYVFQKRTSHCKQGRETRRVPTGVQCFKQVSPSALIRKAAVDEGGPFSRSSVAVAMGNPRFLALPTPSSVVGLGELLEGPALVLYCLFELGVFFHQLVKFLSKDLIRVQDLS